MFGENENDAFVKNQNQESNQVTIKDLVFSIGEKDVIIWQKNKQINNLKSHIKILNDKLSQYCEKTDIEK